MNTDKQTQTSTFGMSVESSDLREFGAVEAPIEESTLLEALQQSWKVIGTLACRLKYLELMDQRRTQSGFKAKQSEFGSSGENALNPSVHSEPPLLAGVYRFEDLMNQAREFLKDDTDEYFDDDISITQRTEEAPPVIPDPPPIIHSYRDCRFLPPDVISYSEEKDSRDEAVDAILSIIEPHETQRAYRASARTFIARVVRRHLGAKVFDTGLSSLQYFLPTDPIRLSVLQGRASASTVDWLTALLEKLRILASDHHQAYKELIVDISREPEESILSEADVIAEHAVKDVEVQSYPPGTLFASGGPPNQDVPMIACMLDDVNPLEIGGHALPELRFLAFIEQVASLVGKEDLFNRSLLLLRAWWKYQAHFNTTTKGEKGEKILDDAVLCVLLCSIFNQHHSVIFHPLQALSIFFAEYSDLDWTTCAVTIQGVVPFRKPKRLRIFGDNEAKKPDDASAGAAAGAGGSDEAGAVVVPVGDDVGGRVGMGAGMCVGVGESGETKKVTGLEVRAEVRSTSSSADETEPWLRPPAEGDLLSAAMLMRYAPPRPPREKKSSRDGTPTQTSAPTPTPAANDLEGEASAAPVEEPASTHGNLDSSDLTTLPGHSLSGDRGTKSPPAPSIQTFKRLDVNVVHPFELANMITCDPCGSAHPPSTTRADRLHQRLESGAKELRQALQMTDGKSLINRFFINVTNTFERGSPDVFKGPHALSQLSSNSRADRNAASDGSVSKEIRLSSLVSLDTLWDQACYVDLVLTGQIHETALLVLSKEILFERGTLPVGEVGKVLQEMTSTSSLSSKLKEKFGGLKKFLERYPEEFVICTDHPFNPHVFVKKALSAEDLDSVAKGLVPQHLTAKFRKALLQRNRKQKIANTPSAGMGDGGGRQMQFMMQQPGSSMNFSGAMVPMSMGPTVQYRGNMTQMSMGQLSVRRPVVTIGSGSGGSANVPQYNVRRPTVPHQSSATSMQPRYAPLQQQQQQQQPQQQQPQQQQQPSTRTQNLQDLPRAPGIQSHGIGTMQQQQQQQQQSFGSILKSAQISSGKGQGQGMMSRSADGYGLGGGLSGHEGPSSSMAGRANSSAGFGAPHYGNVSGGGGGGASYGPHHQQGHGWEFAGAGGEEYRIDHRDASGMSAATGVAGSRADRSYSPGRPTVGGRGGRIPSPSRLGVGSALSAGGGGGAGGGPGAGVGGGAVGGYGHMDHDYPSSHLADRLDRIISGELHGGSGDLLTDITDRFWETRLDSVGGYPHGTFAGAQMVEEYSPLAYDSLHVDEGNALGVLAGATASPWGGSMGVRAGLYGHLGVGADAAQGLPQSHVTQLRGQQQQLQHQHQLHHQQQQQQQQHQQQHQHQLH